jgi:signal transduction histidine kinase
MRKPSCTVQIASGFPVAVRALLLLGVVTATVALWQAFSAGERAQANQGVRAYGFALVSLLALAVWCAWTAWQRTRETMIATRELSDEIASHRQTEESLRRAEKQLLHAQKMNTIGMLSSGIAHDFNNLLTAVSGHANLLQVKITKESPLNGNLEQILVAVDRAARLVRSLLVYSRNQEIEPRALDLNEIVTGARGLIEMLLRSNITLSTSLMNEPLVIMIDRGQLELVLMNIAGNGRDAMPNGGILTISTEQVLLDQGFVTRHGFGAPGSFALLAISDIGTGMDEKTKEQIFEPFFTTKDVDKGTGLGLSTSYRIITQYQGFIKCCSEPGFGTTFKIYLPLVDAQAKETT